MERCNNGAREGHGLTRADLVADPRLLGLLAGATVLTHSSLRSLGWVDGDADTVIDALLEALGPVGTLLVPTLTGTEQGSPRRPPVFDSRATPCWTGRIPETLRRRPVLYAHSVGPGLSTPRLGVCMRRVPGSGAGQCRQLILGVRRRGRQANSLPVVYHGVRRPMSCGYDTRIENRRGPWPTPSVSG